MKELKGRLLLHAPNIHSGGGLNLLNALLTLNTFPFFEVQLDNRIVEQVNIPDTVNKHFVNKTIFARLYAEWRLKKICRKEDTVICLNGLPPLFSLPGKAVVVLQNYLLFEPPIISDFPWQTKLRLLMERAWLLGFKKHASSFIVQSKTMAQLASTQLHSQASISIFPFTNLLEESILRRSETFDSDFIYVASGEAHKNHQCLLDSLLLLAHEDIKPRLILTIDPIFYPELSQKINTYKDLFGLNIHNAGYVSPEEIQVLYQNTKAMIYPSLGESLGLPLIEASSHGIPILAAEKDYVRDVIEPVETFDPLSARSIARAIKRFLKIKDASMIVHSPGAFISKVLS